ncbi:MAG: hypothetical protein EOP48_13880 [Sphingobacteriales bacterium]|nr:MAG: hypothetical protein EOP48_13880 [Sphingobacteriales bacterium]
MIRDSEKLVIENPYIKRNLPSWDKLQIGLFLLLMVMLFLFYGLTLSFLFKLFTNNISNTDFFIRPPDGAWYFVGIILSIGTTGIIMLPIYKAYLRAKYKPGPFLSDDFSKRKVEGFGFIKAFAWILSAVALFFGVHIYDNYVAVDEQSITINEFMHFGEKQYSLHEINSLQYVEVIGKDGYQTDTNYRIQFKDGYTFDSRDNMLDCKDLIQFISAKNNISVDSVERR